MSSQSRGILSTDSAGEVCSTSTLSCPPQTQWHRTVFWSIACCCYVKLVGQKSCVEYVLWPECQTESHCNWWPVSMSSVQPQLGSVEVHPRSGAPYDVFLSVIFFFAFDKMYISYLYFICYTWFPCIYNIERLPHFEVCCLLNFSSKGARFLIKLLTGRTMHHLGASTSNSQPLLMCGPVKRVKYIYVCGLASYRI